MRQEFVVEKESRPMYATRPWRVRCTQGDGPFKPHLSGCFKTKRAAERYAEDMNDGVAQFLDGR